jgi:hypothetical protein
MILVMSAQSSMRRANTLTEEIVDNSPISWCTSQIATAKVQATHIACHTYADLSIP